MAGTRNLRITKCEPVYSGTNSQGGSYTIYEVEACDANTGMMVNVPLRSFDKLDEGQTGEFVVDKYERPGKPTSYTLKKPGGGKGGGGGGNSLGPKVDELRSRVEMLEENLKITQRNLSNLMQRFEQEHPVPTPGGSINTQSPSLSGGGGTSLDDDIPF